MKKYYKYIGISIVIILALIPIGFFTFIGASYYFDENQLPKGEIKSTIPSMFYDADGNPLLIKVGNKYPSSSSNYNENSIINNHFTASQDKYYTPFIMPGPPGSNLYYVSRPNGGYDQVWGPQVK